MSTLPAIDQDVKQELLPGYELAVRCDVKQELLLGYELAVSCALLISLLPVDTWLSDIEWTVFDPESQVFLRGPNPKSLKSVLHALLEVKRVVEELQRQVKSIQQEEIFPMTSVLEHSTSTPPTKRDSNPELAPPLSPDEGWQTVNAPEMYSFEKAGDTIAGKLVSVMPVTVKGKTVTEYMLALGPKRIRLLATYDLLQKLTRSHIGCAVRIKYRGEDKSVSRNGNALKVFDVQVKGTPQPDNGPITDEDIPF
jgi:hypothetical protein